MSLHVYDAHTTIPNTSARVATLQTGMRGTGPDGWTSGLRSTGELPGEGEMEGRRQRGRGGREGGRREGEGKGGRGGREGGRREGGREGGEGGREGGRREGEGEGEGERGRERGREG